MPHNIHLQALASNAGAQGSSQVLTVVVPLVALSCVYGVQADGESLCVQTGRFAVAACCCLDLAAEP